MLTPEEVGQITIFAGLTQAERESISRVAADINLVTGEYAAYEGSEPALFGLLEGRIEAVKRVDGSDRVVGSASPATSAGRCRSRWGRCSRRGSAHRSRRGSCASIRTTST